MPIDGEHVATARPGINVPMRPELHVQRRPNGLSLPLSVAREDDIVVFARSLCSGLPRIGDQSRTSVAGFMPNIRLNVRVRCAESANPASWAASVHDPPAIEDSIATLSLSHRT